MKPERVITLLSVFEKAVIYDTPFPFEESGFNQLLVKSRFDTGMFYKFKISIKQDSGNSIKYRIISPVDRKIERPGIEFPLSRFKAFNRQVPVIANGVFFLFFAATHITIPSLSTSS